MARCRYLVKNAYLPCGAIHIAYSCDNKKCKKYLKYSIDNATVCKNCLLHEKGRGKMTIDEAIERIKYRIETASQVVGKGADGKAFEDLEIAIKALEEKSHNKIHINDVVYSARYDIKGVVLEIGKEFVTVYSTEGNIYTMSLSEITKTGETIDVINTIWGKIGG